MTVLHHGGHSWLPQTETWLYNQVCNLPACIENHIVCEKTENLDQFHVPNIHVLWQESRGRYYWDKGLRKLKLRHHLGFLTQQLKRYNIQLLHSHFGPIGWEDIKAVQIANTKHVVTFYGQDVHHYPQKDARWLKRYRQLFTHIDHVFCEGPHMAQCIIELGCPEQKITVHHLGVSVNQIAFRPRVWQKPDPLRILIAASFQEKKGIPFALEALGKLQQEIPFEITIIGDAQKESRSIAEKNKILHVIKKYQLESRVNMLGFQPHSVFLKEAYAHHIFLSPSISASDGDTEGGAPVSLIEIAATGMPIVSTKHCDIPNVILHEKTGFLAQERNADELIYYLRFLTDHPEKWLGIVESGRRYIEQEFDAQKQATLLAASYERVLNS